MLTSDFDRLGEALYFDGHIKKYYETLGGSWFHFALETENFGCVLDFKTYRRKKNFSHMAGLQYKMFADRFMFRSILYMFIHKIVTVVLLKGALMYEY